MVATLEKFAADASAEYFDAKQKRLTHAIVNGDHESADQITGELISAQQTLGDIYLKVVTPALEGVGESWCRGDIGVGEQKLATEIVIGQLDRLRAHFAPPARRSLYRVMVACIEGEQHFIGARMTADLCGARGWNVDFLGPNVPNEALVNMVHRRHPQVVGLSVTMTQGVENARLVIGDLEKSTCQPRAPQRSASMRAPM